MEILPIGSISLFVNVDDNQNRFLTDKILSGISTIFKKEIKELIKRRNLEHELYLSSIQRRGCIIETISFAIVLGATYKFLKDYDKIRNNLILIFDDLKNTYLKISRKTTNESNTNKVLEDEIELIKNLPDLKNEPVRPAQFLKRPE